MSEAIYCASLVIGFSIVWAGAGISDSIRQVKGAIRDLTSEIIRIRDRKP
jgi:hypothetical protein